MEESTTAFPSNVTNGSTDRVFDCTFDPTAAEIFATISTNPGLLAMIIIGTVLTLCQIISLVEGCVWIAKNIPHEERSSCLLWMFACWPVFSIVSLVGLYIPRAALLSNIAANMFLYPTMYHFLLLIVDYFGGADAMIGKMKGHIVDFNKPPLLCCCCCCPKALCHKNLTKQSFSYIELVVMQVAIVRPVLMFLTMLFDLDGTFPYPSFDFASPHVYIMVFNTVSTLTSMQSIVIIYNASKLALKELGFNILSKFILLESFVLVSGLQNSIFGMALQGQACGNPFPFLSRGSSWNAFITILWGIVFQPVSIKYLRTRKGNVVSLPSQFIRDKKSATTSRLIARAKERLMLKGVDAAVLEEAEEAEETNEKTPLRRRRYSTGCVDVEEKMYKYGSVIDV